MNLAVEIYGKGPERVCGKTPCNQEEWRKEFGKGWRKERVIGCCNTVFETMTTFVDSVDRLIEVEDRR